MANSVAPGIYSKIIDLSNYVAAVPATTSFIVFLSEKGEDNTLKLVSSRSDLVAEFGEPNINAYTRSYSQGLYEAYNHLGESGSLYVIRGLPTDAAYANLRMDATWTASDSTATISTTTVAAINTAAEITTNLAVDGSTNPLLMFYPIGRGSYYNRIGIRVISHVNPMLHGVYTLDIYEKQSDGDEVVIESFEISFDQKATDLQGNSLYVENVINEFSTFFRVEVSETGYANVLKLYDNDVGTVSMVETAAAATITDTKQDFSDWDTTPASGNAAYQVIAYDGKGNKLSGWLGPASGTDNVTCAVYDDRNLTTATQSWIGSTSSFDSNSTITYEIRKWDVDMAVPFASATPVPLRQGSDGGLLNADGSVNTTTADQVLTSAYSGIYDSSVLDKENFYFTLIFDAGYPASVKSTIANLADTRRDCIAILDNGDNTTYASEIQARTATNTFNSKYVSLFSGYNKVYDAFTGGYVWFSPLYHMSYLLPRNDSVSEVWSAAAGFDRASIDTIAELRYNPTATQREQLYLKQVNPIVRFNVGYVVWGNLTTQAKPSALQDLNIMRLILYCDKAISDFCLFYIYQMNDEATWSDVSRNVTEFLQDVQNRRGLYTFSVDVGATEYERRTKQFHVDCILEPTRVVEKIQLNFFVK